MLKQESVSPNVCMVTSLKINDSLHAKYIIICIINTNIIDITSVEEFKN